jgi:hypothetical protein
MNSNRPTIRIIRGKEVSAEEFPWMAALLVMKRFNGLEMFDADPPSNAPPIPSMSRTRSSRSATDRQWAHPLHRIHSSYVTHEWVPISPGSIDTTTLLNQSNRTRRQSPPRPLVTNPLVNSIHFAQLDLTIRSDPHQDCGASIISRRFILTAAHCVEPPEASNFRVGVGSIHLKELKVKQVKAIHVHPKYIPKRFYHDLALIELDEPLQFDESIQPVCVSTPKKLAEHGLDNRYVANRSDDTRLIAATQEQIDHVMPRSMVTGWGYTAYQGVGSDTLLKVQLRLIPLAECARRFLQVTSAHLPQGITKHHLCASGKIGRICFWLALLTLNCFRQV